MSQTGNVGTDIGLKSQSQQDLSGVDHLNQYCVNSVGKDLKVMDIHLYEKSRTPALN